jgi:hypothetical protein
MEFGGFKQFGEPYPMMDIVEVGGFVVWVPPETGRLVARTIFHERIQNELFLWRVSMCVEKCEVVVVITSFCRRLRLPKSGGFDVGPVRTVSTLAAGIFACPECLQ